MFLLLIGPLAEAREPSGPNAGAPTLAVADLGNATGSPEWDGVATGIGALLVTRFARLQSLEVVERERLADVLSELELGARGALDPKTAAKAGKLIGADYIVTGSLFSVQLPAVTVSLRLVDVRTGKIVAAEELSDEVGTGGEKLFLLLDQLAFQIVDQLGIDLGAEDRIALSQVDVRGLNTVSRYGSALDALEAGETARARGLLSEAVALEPGFGQASEALAELQSAVAVRQIELSKTRVSEARQLWSEVGGRARGEARAEDPASIGRLAVRARLALIAGDLPTYLALEAERVALTERWWTSRPRGVMYVGGPLAPIIEGAQAALAGTARRPGARFLEGLRYRPDLIRLEMASVQLRRGDRAAAVAAVIDAWRLAWPSADPEPVHPRETFTSAGLVGEAVGLLRQDIALARRSGDTDGEAAALRRLEPLLAAQARAAADAPLLSAVAAATARPTAADLGRERQAVALWPSDQVEAAWLQFQRRLEAGAYGGLAATPELRALAQAWSDRLAAEWPEDWAGERRLADLRVIGQVAPELVSARTLDAWVEEAYGPVPPARPGSP